MSTQVNFRDNVRQHTTLIIIEHLIAPFEKLISRDRIVK